MNPYFLAPIVFICLTAFSARAQCLKYESETTALVGTIYSKVFAGPPNYESIKAGDQKETATILKLNSPICTLADDLNDFNVPESKVSRVQLVITAPGFWTMIRQNRGKPLRVTGSLFHGHTGHHRTRVLLLVSDLKPL